MPKVKFKKTDVPSPAPSPKHYMYPNSETLKNKYGITNSDLFTAKYTHDLAQAIINLRKSPFPEKFDSSYLCHIHHQLFKNTFEWAGQPRHVPFTFKDGTTAVIQKMKRTGCKNSFALSNEIQEGLQKLDQILVEKNNLQGLTREKFNSEAISLFNSLDYLHPFREGNESTQQVFFENLAKVAGHQLDFSLITKKRMMLANVAVAENGDLESMQHLFEDISNPNKILLLKEFMSNMKELGYDVNDYSIMVAKEGETYTGIYKGAHYNSFTFKVNGAYIISDKEHLTPEQLQTLKPGDRFTFTVPQTQELKNTLIPKGKFAPLEKTKLSELIAEDACVHTAQHQIQKLSKIVYGSINTLNEKMVEIIKNPYLGQQLANQIAKAPDSIAHLAGFSFFGLQNQARADARNHLDMLCTAVANFTHAVKHAEKEIKQEHTTEQNRCAKTVKMPSQSLQDLFSLPKELQQEILAKNPSLQKELTNFVKNIQIRLSSNEHKAIQKNEYETLAKSIGVSETKAKQITQIIKQTKEIHQQSQLCTTHRSKVFAIAC
ncbi:fido (protein-threonine AMPylation protein) [Bartonella fuyuanensis]|uniref:protein adenylyltransferase n=1 Tax=Bartonella fuyuanensis TaxID=1460968 RepID=A0A840E6Y0_9HYPH|nr:BID domain-containing T4SS effector [Bartonella fuyuanensis]MBB4076856.1 fido (protein-threonine AMPylation protein) [Bartonella fuyuanensis]